MNGNKFIKFKSKKCSFEILKNVNYLLMNMQNALIIYKEINFLSHQSKDCNHIIISNFFNEEFNQFIKSYYWISYNHINDNKNYYRKLFNLFKISFINDIKNIRCYSGEYLTSFTFQLFKVYNKINLFISISFWFWKIFINKTIKNCFII